MARRSWWRIILQQPFCSLVLLLATATPGRAQPHLVLSEVALSGAGEFIEVYNPTASTISLDHYYLADNFSYAYLPAGGLGLDSGDFIVRFPIASSIDPGQVVVVAVNGGSFITTYAQTPDFEIISTDPGVPDMVVIAQGVTPSLTNSGEGIVLFYWNGLSDLVGDVDLINVGVPTAANRLIGKSGISVDGPDADAVATAYLTDASTMPLQASAPGLGLSTKRVALENGLEVWTGGNGITGHDETTEITTITWDQVFTAPDPGFVHNVAAVDGPVGAAGPLRIYPNPSAGAVTIELASAAFPPTSHVGVYAVTGERVYSGGTRAEGGRIALRLRPGLYWVRVSGGGASAMRKIVVLER